MTSQERRAYRKLATHLSGLSAKAWAITDCGHICDVDKLREDLLHGISELCSDCGMHEKTPVKKGK